MKTGNKYWALFDEGNNDGLAVFSDTMDFCMNIIEGGMRVANNEDYLALKQAAEDRGGWRHRKWCQRNLLYSRRLLKVKWCERKSAGKMDPSHPAFPGHSRSFEPTRIDRLPVTSYLRSIVAIAISRTVSETNGDCGWKSQNFLPRVFNAPRWVSSP